MGAIHKLSAAHVTKARRKGYHGDGGGLFVGESAEPPVTRLQNAFVVFNQTLNSGGGIYASTTTTTPLTAYGSARGSDSPLRGLALITTRAIDPTTSAISAGPARY